MNEMKHKITEKEKELFSKLLGDNYEIIDSVDGLCFVLNANGEYNYNDCFFPTNNDYFMQQKYKLVNPDMMIKFFQYYIIKVITDSEIWFRGWKSDNGNYEFDCCADSLQEIIDSL